MFRCTKQTCYDSGDAGTRRRRVVWADMALSLKQEQFVAAYVGVANGNATEAARIAGYAGSDGTLGVTGHGLIKNPKIADRIAAYRATIESAGIANQQNRIDAYNERWRLLKQIREERAADDWLADVPGGRTGFVVKQLKTVKHHYLPDPDDEDGKPSQMLVETWESAVDTGFLKEFRELEKQAAQDVGQWTEKRELAGPNGGPIEITGIAVPLPVRDGDS